MRQYVIGAVAMVCTQAACADSGSQYTLAPRVAVLTRGDDNLLLSSGDPIVTGGADTSASFNLSRQTASLKSDLVPRVNLRRFVVDSGFDADEYGVNFNNDWTGEYLTAALDVGYSHDSTLVTEASDTGLSRDVINRDSVDVSPSLVWLISERWQSQFSLYYNDISYASSASGLLDYRYLMGSTTTSYIYDDTTQLSLTFFTSDFDVPSIGNHTRTYGIQTGASKALTETIKVSASVGYVFSDIDSVEQQVSFATNPPSIVDVPVTASSSGPIANFAVRKQLSKVSIGTFEYSRQLSPSGRGTQTIADRMALRTDLKLRDKWLLILSASYDMRASEGGLFARDTDRDFTEARSSLRYEFTREWSMTGSYRFAFRKNTGLSTDSASGHAVSLNIEYNGQPRPISSLNGL